MAKELPPKTEIIELVRLEGAQRDLYETVRALMHTKVRDEIARKGLAKSLYRISRRTAEVAPKYAAMAIAITTSEAREKLSQVRTVDGNDSRASQRGATIILFSQFTSMLALIEEGSQGSKFLTCC